MIVGKPNNKKILSLHIVLGQSDVRSTFAVRPPHYNEGNYDAIIYYSYLCEVLNIVKILSIVRLLLHFVNS